MRLWREPLELSVPTIHIVFIEPRCTEHGHPALFVQGASLLEAGSVPEQVDHDTLLLPELRDLLVETAELTFEDLYALSPRGGEKLLDLFER